LGNVLAADEIGGDALRTLIFSNCLAKFPDHRLMREMCHEKAILGVCAKLRLRGKWKLNAVHGATIENNIGHISASHCGRAFRGVPSEEYGNAEAIVHFVDRREQREAAGRAQELALQTFNNPKVANSAISLA
jgi:hypothetical protein